jgi:tetratricopeptide (TPR) repeat protein
VKKRRTPGADHDLAGACFLLARGFEAASASEQALPLLDEAQKRFETVERDNPGEGGERMASVCVGVRGDCLVSLGRLDQAAAAYEEKTHRAEKIGDARQFAVGIFQLGGVRSVQGRHEEALKAYEEARERFGRLNEPVSVAEIWHQSGTVYHLVGQPEAAQDAYRKSLALRVLSGDPGEGCVLRETEN